VDVGIIHPYAVAGPGGEALLVSGRAMRAEHRMHLADTKARHRAVARRAPKPGQRGSRRWRKYRARARVVQGRHRRRVRQAQHEAARTVVTWAVNRRVGVLHVGDPRGVLNLSAGRRHNLRLRQWQIGRLLQILTDKATLAGITVRLVDERGTSSTCPTCRHRVLPGVVTHRRAGRHLPGAGRSRRDPRRPPGRREGQNGRLWPAPPTGGGESLANSARIHNTAPQTR
jgi:IS605 OrfB family transposase